MKDFNLQRLNHLQYFYYFLLGLISLTVLSGVIFSTLQFDTPASAESTPVSALNLPAASDTASEAIYTDNSLIDSAPTEVTPNPSEIATTPVITERPVTTQTVTTAQTQTTRTLSDTPTYITAAGRTSHITVVDDTSVDPGDEVKRLRLGGTLTNFYYGHNRAHVFGGLGSLKIGDTFSITAENGTVHTYTIKDMKWLSYDDTAKNMTDIAYSRWTDDGEHYTRYVISLMTCTSASYYGGRLIVFAD